MRICSPRLLRLLLGLSVLVNVAVIAGIAVMLASSSAAAWIAPRLHLATRAAVISAQISADDAASSADDAAIAVEDVDSRVSDLENVDADSRIDDLETTVGSFCDEFANYSGAFEEIYSIAC